MNKSPIPCAFLLDFSPQRSLPPRRGICHHFFLTSHRAAQRCGSSSGRSSTTDKGRLPAARERDRILFRRRRLLKPDILSRSQIRPETTVRRPISPSKKPRIIPEKASNGVSPRVMNKNQEMSLHVLLSVSKRASQLEGHRAFQCASESVCFEQHGHRKAPVAKPTAACESGRRLPQSKTLRERPSLAYSWSA